jgi:hypothetical protein
MDELGRRDDVGRRRQATQLKVPRTAHYGGEAYMPFGLTPPAKLTFFISVLVAAAAIIIHYARLSIPYVHSGFLILLVGYFVLLAGNLFRGL